MPESLEAGQLAPCQSQDIRHGTDAEWKQHRGRLAYRQANGRCQQHQGVCSTALPHSLPSTEKMLAPSPRPLAPFLPPAAAAARGLLLGTLAISCQSSARPPVARGAAGGGATTAADGAAAGVAALPFFLLLATCLASSTSLRFRNSATNVDTPEGLQTWEPQISKQGECQRVLYTIIKRQYQSHVWTSDAGTHTASGLTAPA